MTSVLWESNEVALVTGGKNTISWEALGVSIDTRSLKKGDMFIAISDKRDGHEFIEEAFQSGAAVAVVSRIPSGVSPKNPFLVVPDVLEALNALALFARKRATASFIAITGSVGKTGSKDMLAEMLKSFGKVHKAEKSFNNHFGVPLTLCRTPRDADFVVLEIGMSGKGEILPLSKLATPHIALITNVSEAHLASFESIREIAKEKSEISKVLPFNAYCIVCRDSEIYPALLRFIKQNEVQVLSFGETGRPTYRLIQTVAKNNVTCAKARLPNGNEFYFKVNNPGRHHAINALGTIAVLEGLGLDAAKGALALSNWVPTKGRGVFSTVDCTTQKLNGTFTIIDETYNANPKSMEAAVSILSNFESQSWLDDDCLVTRRVAILGDMLELGESENKRHASLCENLNLSNIDIIHCIGPRMKFFYKTLPVSKRGRWVRTVDEISKRIVNLIRANDIVMLKASNGMGLFKLVSELKAMGKTFENHRKGI